MIDVYCELHQMGLAKSVEVWLDNKLVGGLYGVDLMRIFCGESMFSKENNASKIGFISFIQMSKFKLIDCQVALRSPGKFRRRANQVDQISCSI